ncbi:hypothetical protein FK178_08210 [Antarcticibacterium arcticum]|uniref:Pyrroline-5-carboxylate reductase catalytic N-terminal domain-containing protein n=1 Tax=Antarcticibacterium arcticum TaxID=2585771 RepID=A0A5B8YN79_9FLAO|nr:hypothetical protein [Antarcticibacterium arcticum]QED37706.1 hypothetical protein FK178_08210 [Antarcticibacterium arcticum]
MMTPKTMAILGDTGKFSPAMLEILARLDLRLLFVSEDEALKKELKKELRDLKTIGEIDFTGCEREGCWEADIIVLYKPDANRSSHMERIKEVATQKIVLVISDEIGPQEIGGLKKLLPNSMVVQVAFSTQQKNIKVCSEDIKVKAEVKRLFEPSGIQIN